MIIVISPAKTMNFTDPGPGSLSSFPEFGKESAVISEKMSKFSAQQLGTLMGISSKLAYLNYDRFQEWRLAKAMPEAKQALLAYKGDVYNGLLAQELSEEGLLWAQNHLRILSGLYGILRPLDMIMPYRLEYATKLKLGKYKNLYEYWKKHLARSLESLKQSEGSGILINLASAEYYKALETKKSGFEVITPVFKEYRNGEFRFYSMFGKKARGMMARYIIQKKIKKPEEIKLFSEEGYSYNEPLSGDREWVFTR
jgi:cytoplasmic iron level regulating protein YaaA (DUF328/UPF0246 family)